MLLNTIGPVWDGNEVWLITAGAAMFAAFPAWYAEVFSGFYLVLLAMLVGLIVRVCAIEWRGKINDPRWRTLGGLRYRPGLLDPRFGWGLVFANIVRGVDVNERGRDDLRRVVAAEPVRPAGRRRAAGAVPPARRDLRRAQDRRRRAHRRAAFALRIWLPVTVIGAAFVVWTQLAHGKPWTWAMVGLAAAGLLLAGALIKADRELGAFFFTCLTVIAVSVLLFGSLFPNVLNATDPAHIAHDRGRGVRGIHAEGDVLGHRGDPADGDDLPGVDILGVPRSASCASQIPPSIGLRPACLTRGPVDPRLLRYARASPRAARRGVGCGVVATAALIVLAYAVATVCPASSPARRTTSRARCRWRARPPGCGCWSTYVRSRIERRAADRVVSQLRVAALAARRAGRAADREELRTALTRGLDELPPYLTGYLPALALTVIAHAGAGDRDVRRRPDVRRASRSARCRCCRCSWC